MVSSVLSNLLLKIEQSSIHSRDALVALHVARQRIIQLAPTFPCYRCNHAGWVATFEVFQGGDDKEFFFALSKCSGGVVLPPREGQLGLLPPAGPFFCSAENQQEDPGAIGSMAVVPLRSRTSELTEVYPRSRGAY